MTVSGSLGVVVIADVTGRTRVQRLVQSYPQRVTAPMHVDVDPRIAYLCVQNPSGGIFADDALRTSVRARSGAHLLLTSQAATQVYDGHTGPGAHHDQELRVESGAVVEYVPREIIPQADSRFSQRTDIDVDDGGVFLGWETIAAGRIGHGERHRYRSVTAQTSVRVNGETIARDALRFTRESSCRTRARLMGADYCATLWIIAPGRDLAGVIHQIGDCADASAALVGISELPDGCGLVVRVLADHAPLLRTVLSQIIRAHRYHLLDLPPPPQRLI